MSFKPLSSVLSIFFITIACQKQKPTEEQEETANVNLIETPSSVGSSLPCLIKGEDGFLYMSWVEKLDSGVTELRYAKYANSEWSTPELIASGNDWFVNWADYPMIAVDNQGNMIANYLAKSTSGTYSYDVNVVLKSFKSNTWSSAIIPHKDGTPAEYGFVTLMPQNDGTFLLGWLDGRNTAGGTHDQPAGAMTIRSAVMDMNGDLSEEVELDGRVCDCCQTDGVMTSSGPIIAYRDRSEFEIRDMSLVRRVDGEWTSPSTVYSDNWEVPGCPVNGPRLAAIENAVGVAWFTAANGLPKVNFAYSNDGGESFGTPLEIAATNTTGRVDVIMVDTSTAYVSWLGISDSTSMIILRKINFNGEMEAPIMIAETSASRASGFPQMEFGDKEIILSWTDVQNDRPRIKMASVSLLPN